MRSPKVSIIVPNYNHAQFLEQRLDSIFNQTFEDFEVILLDDKSTDASLSILNRYSTLPRVSQYIVNKTNSGSPYEQWKKGVGLAKGDYVWIAESDDWADPNFLEFTIEVIEKNKDCAIVFTDNFILQNGILKPNEWLDEINQAYGSQLISGNELLENYLSKKCVIPSISSVLMRRDFLPISVLDQMIKYRLYGDWFLYIHLASCFNFYYLSKKLSSLRILNTSHSRKKGVEKVQIRERTMLLSILKKSSISKLTLTAFRQRVFHLIINQRLKGNISSYGQLFLLGNLMLVDFKSLMDLAYYFKTQFLKSSDD